MAVQLGTSKNVVFVKDYSSEATPDLSADNVLAYINIMFKTEGVFKKCRMFLEGLIEQCEISVSETLVDKKSSIVYRDFLLQSVPYYMTTGFVIFRMVQNEKKFLPVVVPSHMVEWEYEPEVDENAFPKIQVSLDKFSEQDRAQPPRLYVYFFNKDKDFGIMRTCVDSYRRLLSYREYEQVRVPLVSAHHCSTNRDPVSRR